MNLASVYGEHTAPSELSTYTCVALLNMIFQARLVPGMCQHFLFLSRSTVIRAPPPPLDLDREAGSAFGLPVCPLRLGLQL